MAYRRRTAVIYKNGRRYVRRVAGKGPKHKHRIGYFWGSSVFNLGWLFGRNRVYRRK